MKTVCGHLDLFDILIQYEAPIHTADIYGAFPIHYASQLCGNDDPVKSIDKILLFLRGEIFILIWWILDLVMLKKLIDNKAEVDCLDEKQRTPFMWAANASE